ncbi:MAG TPA: molybdopterin-dependent oxidoreductase [Macromonas sp.]|nr:molybdopterin-dependent oxidoreductase [Macromonas sp.]
MKSKIIHTCRGLFLLLLLAVTPGWALEPAKGKVILTVSGQIEAKNQGEQAIFDLAMLEALPQRTFTTQTPWDNAPQTFTGPLLRDVLATVQAKGAHIHAVALNDYRITIPLDDTRKYDMLLALRINGATIPVRSKGPLFIVYPFDSAKELQSKTYYERSIWQLKTIEID